MNDTTVRSALVCRCGMGMFVSPDSGLTHHTDGNAPLARLGTGMLGIDMLADLDHLAVADPDDEWSPLRVNAAPTPCRPPLLHFTMTDVHAGTYFCLEVTASMTAGGYGRRLPQDRGAHYAYCTDVTLARADVCPDCRHVAECPYNGKCCAVCKAFGYTDS